MRSILAGDSKDAEARSLGPASPPECAHEHGCYQRKRRIGSPLLVSGKAGPVSKPLPGDKNARGSPCGQNKLLRAVASCDQGGEFAALRDVGKKGIPPVACQRESGSFRNGKPTTGRGKLQGPFRWLPHSETNPFGHIRIRDAAWSTQTGGFSGWGLITPHAPANWWPKEGGGLHEAHGRLCPAPPKMREPLKMRRAREKRVCSFWLSLSLVFAQTLFWDTPVWRKGQRVEQIVSLHVHGNFAQYPRPPFDVFLLQCLWSGSP